MDAAVERGGGKLPFSDEWKVNTMDITVAVLLGVVQGVVVVTGALDYFARALQTVGFAGFVLAMTIVGFYGPLIVTAGYLRKRILVPFIAGTILALMRWFTGDPDGILQLVWWGVGSLIFGLIMWAFKWKDQWWRYGIAAAVMCGWAAGVWFFITGIRALGWSAYFISQPTVIIAGFFLSGLIGYGLGKALERVGIAAVER
jgi:ABC-type thiamin/hydroxymethylpyrimidine transport system permease subunit